MDNRKVEQVLKEIFDRYGVEITHEHSKFEGAVSDLLDERRYPEERAVLRRASESKALWTLLKAKYITDEGAENAVVCLERENRMTREDAVFVVRCVVSARGGNPDIVKSQKPGGGATGGANHVGDSGNKTDNQGSGNQSVAPRIKPKDTSVCLLEAPCLANMGRRKGDTKGKLFLYSNRMEFIPLKGEGINLLYQDIHKMNFPHGWFVFLVILYILGIFALVTSVGAIEGIFVAILCLGGGLFYHRDIARFNIQIWTHIEDEMGYKIFYNIRFLGAHKKRAIEIIKKGMKGQL